MLNLGKILNKIIREYLYRKPKESVRPDSEQVGSPHVRLSRRGYEIMNDNVLGNAVINAVLENKDKLANGESIAITEKGKMLEISQVGSILNVHV